MSLVQPRPFVVPVPPLARGKTPARFDAIVDVAALLVSGPETNEASTAVAALFVVLPVPPLATGRIPVRFDEVVDVAALPVIELDRDPVVAVMTPLLALSTPESEPILTDPFRRAKATGPLKVDSKLNDEPPASYTPNSANLTHVLSPAASWTMIYCAKKGVKFVRVKIWSVVLVTVTTVTTFENPQLVEYWIEKLGGRSL